MIADMHIHYPMAVITENPNYIVDRLWRLRRRPLLDKLRLLLIRAARQRLSDETSKSGPRVDMERMRAGNVGVAFSVLYVPEAEWDAFHLHGVPPKAEYFAQLMGHMALVEWDLRRRHESVATVVRDADALDRALAEGKIAIVHCVEGGFHLGHSADQIADSIHRLAAAGVGYVTLAHLFWRKVATSAPAIPFLEDWQYDLVFPQPRREGLGELGRAAVAAMVREGILVDVSHMREAALDEALDLVESLDASMPVIASHAGYRFGELDYMLDDHTIGRIAERNGVIGLIMAEHQLRDGVRENDARSLEPFDVICAHIDRIHELTDSYENIAIGSDLDGFIKPTMSGFDDARELGDLERRLKERYPGAAELITSANAIRVLKAAWARRTA